MTGQAELLRDAMTAYAARRPVSSVAVLGNAPLEPSAERADRIDAADLVLRVNSFVLDHPGEPRRQGRRVDVVVWPRLTQATPDLFDRYRERLYLLAEPMRMHGRREVWPPSWPADLGLMPLPNREVACRINADLGFGPDDRLAPTTGLTAAWLAVTLFPDAEVLLAGFSFLDDPHQSRWRHQWGDEVRVGPEHRIEAEARLMRSWIDDGRATFVR